jgi:hypothetical protein
MTHIMEYFCRKLSLAWNTWKHNFDYGNFCQGVKPYLFMKLVYYKAYFIDL